MRGSGRVFKRGRIWWVAWSVGGKEYRESSQSEVRDDAVNLLRDKVGSRPARGTFEQLVTILKDDYQLNGRRSWDRAAQCVAHLRQRFAAGDFGPRKLAEYAVLRVSEGAKSGTVRRELAILRRMLRLARAVGLFGTLPQFPTVRPGPAREGFLEGEDFERVVSRLPGYLRPYIRFLYESGWRRREAASLTWKDVDLERGLIRLCTSHSKSERPRALPFAAHAGLAALIRRQREMTTRLERDTGAIVPWVFHREGRPIADPRVAWRNACKASGVGGRTIHDLRRSAVRNMIRAGVPQSVAMRLTGHRSLDVFRRYDIVDEADLAAGMQRLGQSRQKSDKKSDRTA